jgi:hypothetical protein
LSASAGLAREERNGGLARAVRAPWRKSASNFRLPDASRPRLLTTLKLEAYSLDGACTNWAEEFFSRMRRAEQGHHHHIAGPYLLRYAQEASWREDHRRISNGDQVHAVSGLAMRRGPSEDFFADIGNGAARRDDVDKCADIRA